MKVLVTGGNGEVGEAVVNELRRHHTVRVADIRLPDAAGRAPDVEWLACDLTDQGAADAAVAGQEAVVHLAAIPNSFTAPGTEILRVNMLSSFTVAEACKSHGVAKVIYAGSDSGMGFGIRSRNYRPLYLPIDAAHPCWPHESYSLTKYFGERLFAEYARAFGIPTVSIRLLYVLLERRCRDEFLDALAHRGDARRADWMGGYVMPQDVAGMVAAALAYDMRGSSPDHPFEIFFAHAEDTLNSLFTDRTTLEQARLLWGDPPPVTDGNPYVANPRAPFYDIASTKALLGYTPRFTFRDSPHYREA